MLAFSLAELSPGYAATAVPRIIPYLVPVLQVGLCYYNIIGISAV